MNTRLQLYFNGVCWFILSLISSSINDLISKYVGTRLHSYEITFFRFFFSTVTLLPFIIYHRNTNTTGLRTRHPAIHFLRGILLFLGIAGWTYGVTIAPLTTGTVISFTIPVFVLVIGKFTLNENIIWQRWLVTIISFIGLIITLDVKSELFNPQILIFVIAAVMFAILDIINKKFVDRESMIGMLFYSAVITTFLTLPFASWYWLTPDYLELLLLFILGSSANLILFFLLKAFTLVDATALAPYRYLELLLSALVAYIVFSEIPSQTTILGALIIIPSTLFIIFSEQKELNKKDVLPDLISN